MECLRAHVCAAGHENPCFTHARASRPLGHARAGATGSRAPLLIAGFWLERGLQDQGQFEHTPQQRGNWHGATFGSKRSLSASDHISGQLCPISAESGRSRPSPARFRPTSAPSRPNLLDFGRVWSNIGDIVARSCWGLDRIPTSANVGPGSSIGGFGLIFTDFGHSLRHFGPTCGPS